MSTEKGSEKGKSKKADEESEPSGGLNKDGTPDMRLKENRDDPEKVAEAAERKAEHAVPEAGHNKDGTPDMRLKENRDNPDLVAQKKS